MVAYPALADAGGSVSDRRPALLKGRRKRPLLFPELAPANTIAEVAATRNAGRWYGNGRDWETPPAMFEALDAEFHFTLDPCARPQTAKTKRFFTEADNGLVQDWGVDRVFMNPPYGREISAWTRKARESAARGALVVGLLPASTDLGWWHEDVLGPGAEVRFIRGRVKFLADGVKWTNGFFASVIVVWRPS